MILTVSHSELQKKAELMKSMQEAKGKFLEKRVLKKLQIKYKGLFFSFAHLVK